MNPFVPDFILQNDLRGRTAGTFEGAALFVDIAGFTPLTERLLAHGREGAEALAHALRFHFDPIVAAAQEAGGFVTGFAGDACTALFPDTPERNAALYALDAAHRMQRFLVRYPVYRTPHGEFPFSIRVGLSWGRVDWGIVRVGEARSFYHFHGPAIDGSAAAEHGAQEGEVILDEALLQRLPEAPAALVTTTAVEGRFRAGPAMRPQRPVPASFLAAPTEGASFLAPGVAEIPPQGELRDVATVFLAFDGASDVEGLIRLLDDLAGRYGGTFTGLGFGDKGVTSVVHFGAPVSHENDTERALDFVLELRRFVTEPLARVRAGVTRDVHYVGWNGGSRRREFACLGRGTNLAARLMTAAAWGEILCDPTVYADAASGYELALRGDVHLRGFERPVRVHALGPRRASPVHERPSAGKELVGRGPELSRLLSSVAPVFTGHFAGVVYVDGEAGLGKSFLVQTARERIAARFDGEHGDPPFLWIEAPCDPTLQRSLNAFEVALGEYFQQSTGASREENVAAFEAVLSTLVDRVPPAEEALRSQILGARSIYGALVGLRPPGSLYERLGPRERFERTLAAVAAWVHAESRSRPVILHLEDAHWADGDTLRAVQAITRPALGGGAATAGNRPRLFRGFPVAVLCTARYTDDGGPFRIVLDAGVPVRNIALVPLGAEEIGRIAASAGGEPLPSSLLAMLVDGAGGNPFFAEEIVASFHEAPPGDVSISAPSVGLLPTDVNSLLVARLDRLPPAVKLTVLAASVLGKELDLRVLTAMVALDGRAGEVAEHVRVAEEQRVLVRVGRARVAFRNTMLRNAAYEMQARARLVRLHQLAAEAILALHEPDLEPHCAALARHFRRASLPEPARRWFLAAARAAVGRYAHSEARRHYKSYFKLVTQPSAETALARYELATGVHEPRGDFGRALDEHAAAIEEAQRLGDVGLEALGHLGLGRVALALERPEEAAGHLVNAVDRARSAGVTWTLALALAHLALVHREGSRHADAERTFAEALSVGRAAGRAEGLSAFDDMVRHDAREPHPAETLALYAQAMGLARPSK